MLAIVDNAHKTLPIDTIKASASVISMLQNSNLSDDEKKTLATKLIRYLEEHIDSYPKVQTIIAGGHIKYTESHSSIIAACLNALSQQYNIPLTPLVSLNQLAKVLSTQLLSLVQCLSQNPYLYCF